MKKLKVHESRRYLMWADGTPFFYLGDTAWELFHRLSRGEIEHYLSVRAAQGFNVIQAVALAEFEGLTLPNAHGRLPLLMKDGIWDPVYPDEGGGYDYWHHVDFAVDAAAEKGLFVGILPTWGDKFNQKWGQGPKIFTPENAEIYGQWLGRRYRDRWNIIWILGGDRPLETQDHRDIVDAMAGGILGEDGNHLMTYHPMGGTSSADYVSGRDYIDFHMVQSGHGLESYGSWRLVRRTGDAEKKPVMDSEPRYEDHPACFSAQYGYYWDAADVRQNAYWDLMEGVCGHTYGNHCIWKFNTQPQEYFPYRWQQALHHPGAGLMKHLMNLRLSRSYFDFRSASELVVDDPAAMAHLCAGRGEDYAFFYSPLGQPIRARLQEMGGVAMRMSWYDPRTGESTVFAVVPSSETLLVPPTAGKGCDWVLVADRLN